MIEMKQLLMLLVSSFAVSLFADLISQIETFLKQLKHLGFLLTEAIDERL